MNYHIEGFVEDIIGPVYLAKLKLLCNKNRKNALYDVLTFKILKKHLRDDSVCVDVGCHTGSVLRAMMKYAPNGKFYAFEPLPHLYQYLYEHFGANTAVKLFPIALSNKKGTSRFNYVISNPGYSGFLKRRYDRPSEKDTEIVVATDSLDSLIEHDDRISLIKIDVEGAELMVLQGAVNTIRRNRPVIIFEHGVGGADIYQSGPDDIYNLIYEECGMNISTLDEWLRNKSPLSRHEFRDQFKRGLNYYFIAHAGHPLKKKMILISPHDVFPPKDGGDRRIYLLTKSLTKTHDVTYVGPFLENRKSVDLPINVVEAFPNRAKYKTLNFSLIKAVRNLLKQNPEAEIRLEFPWQGINMPFIGRRFVLDEHNVEFLRCKRMGSKIWIFVYIYEFLVCHLSKRVICVSQTDRDFLARYFRLNTEKIEVVENPVDTSIFFQDTKNVRKIRQELRLKDDEKFVLFFGQLDNRPAIEALEIIINKIVPGLDRLGIKYKLVICGKGDGKGFLRNFTHRNVMFKGFVERIQDYINASDVIIVPLMSGSGTRMKILESLACGKRVVSTTIGAEGLGKNTLLEIEDNWDRFVERIR